MPRSVALKNTETVALGLVALLGLLGCGERMNGPSLGPQDLNPLRGTALDLPLVGTVGVEPRTDRRLVISVTREGWLRIPGRRKPVGLERLRKWLASKADDPRMRDVDGTSRLNVILDIDASMPWLAGMWLMMVCADPSVRIYRIHFGARSTRDGAVGVLSAALPKDRRGPLIVDGPQPLILRVKLLSTDAQHSDVRALYNMLESMDSEARRTAYYELVAPPPKGDRVPHGTVVQALDVLLAAGARDIVFEGAAMPLQPEGADEAAAFRRVMLELRGRAGGLRIKVGDRVIGRSSAADLDVPARGRIDAVWGIAFEEPELTPEETEETADGELPIGCLVEEPEMQRGWPNDSRLAEGHRLGGAFPSRVDPPGEEPDAQSAAEAVDRALRWLAAHQSANGGWEAARFGSWCDGDEVADASHGPGRKQFDVGVSGLALSAFLGAGYTNRGKHPFNRVVSKGLRYLKNVQDHEGHFGPRSPPRSIYNHAAAALAMVEVYGMTGSPIFKGSAQRSLDFIAKARNLDRVWRYGVKPGDNDTSVTAWMTAVLHSARLINRDAVKRGKREPLSIDEEALATVRTWLDEVTDPLTQRVGYTQAGQGPSRTTAQLERFPRNQTASLTAMGVLCRILLGADPRLGGRAWDGVAWLLAHPPSWDPQAGSIDMIYWYFGAYAVFHVWGDAWNAWAPELESAALAKQRRDGEPCGLAGSWDPIGVWGQEGGRVYSTALMALILERRGRYRRVFAGR